MHHACQLDFIRYLVQCSQVLRKDLSGKSSLAVVRWADCMQQEGQGTRVPGGLPSPAAPGTKEAFGAYWMDQKMVMG